jgi:hypothetical protein
MEKMGGFEESSKTLFFEKYLNFMGKKRRFMTKKRVKIA